MSAYTPSTDSLNDVMRVIRWDDFKYVVQSVKDIAAEVRKDDRRKKREFVTCLVITPIKGILATISKMFNYRYNDNSLFQLLSDAVRKINILIREIEEYRQSKYLNKLKEISDILISFIGEQQRIQLDLFDSEKYFDPKGVKRKLPCFVRWYNSRLRDTLLHFRDKSRKVGFSNPLKCGKIPHTQITIPFGRANIEAAPEVSEEVEVSPAPKENSSSDVEDLNELGLRTLRKVARFLGVAQKVDGKDRSKASFLEVLKELLQTDRERVSEALATFG